MLRYFFFYLAFFLLFFLLLASRAAAAATSFTFCFSVFDLSFSLIFLYLTSSSSLLSLSKFSCVYWQYCLFLDLFICLSYSLLLPISSNCSSLLANSLASSSFSVPKRNLCRVFFSFTNKFIFSFSSLNFFLSSCEFFEISWRLPLSLLRFFWFLLCRMRTWLR